MSATQTEQNKATAARFLAAMESSDLPGLQALLSDDFAWWILGKPEYLATAGEHDRDFLINFFKGSDTNFPEGVSLKPSSMVAEGDKVAVEAEIKAVTAAGVSYNNSYHFMFEIRNGQITRMNEYMDTFHAKEVFGL
ncbi:MAG: nuclear transport factor 2 family protein [Nannocystaceae bacterium]|nr:nuclear transport factor 2 family protein [Nannocystaceae bacterium]